MELCHHVVLPRDAAIDFEVNPSYSTYIEHIKVECTREKADRRSATPVNKSPEVDIDLIPAPASLPTLASGPLGISALTSSS